MMDLRGRGGLLERPGYGVIALFLFSLSLSSTLMSRHGAMISGAQYLFDHNQWPELAMLITAIAGRCRIRALAVPSAGAAVLLAGVKLWLAHLHHYHLEAGALLYVASVALTLRYAVGVGLEPRRAPVTPPAPLPKATLRAPRRSAQQRVQP